MNFKVDEDLPHEVAQMFRARGFDARTVVEQGLGGYRDSDLWPILQDEGRCLVTADKGFANQHMHPVGSHAGIVLFRLPRESRNVYVQLSEMFLDSGKVEMAAGAIVVVSPGVIRFHKE
jgi:predicted nuclease of predicted toxin-antitoxin system